VLTATLRSCSIINRMETTELARDETATMAALRRLAVLDDMLWRLRQEVLPTRMVAGALGAIVAALGAEGAAIVATGAGAAEARMRHRAGVAPEPLPLTLPALVDRDAAPVMIKGRDYLACPCRTRFHPPEFLLVWRAEHAPLWSEDDCRVVDAAAGLLRLVLEHEAIQQETVSQSRTDPLTGLPDRRGFAEALTRRIGRLDHDGLPGTILLIDVDGLGAVNARAGLETGDAVLRTLAALLHAAFRPTDLVARVGGGVFGVWMDGADELAAAERAEALRGAAADRWAGLAAEAVVMPSLSIAIGTRWCREGEDVDALMARVDALLGEVKRTVPGTCRVSQG
jgi:diguanylate cyclase (GGDEF)-like protein